MARKVNVKVKGGNGTSTRVKETNTLQGKKFVRLETENSHHGTIAVLDITTRAQGEKLMATIRRALENTFD